MGSGAGTSSAAQRARPGLRAPPEESTRTTEEGAKSARVCVGSSVTTGGAVKRRRDSVSGAKTSARSKSTTLWRVSWTPKVAVTATSCESTRILRRAAAYSGVLRSLSSSLAAAVVKGTSCRCFAARCAAAWRTNDESDGCRVVVARTVVFSSLWRSELTARNWRSGTVGELSSASRRRRCSFRKSRSASLSARVAPAPPVKSSRDDRKASNVPRCGCGCAGGGQCAASSERARRSSGFVRVSKSRSPPRVSASSPSAFSRKPTARKTSTPPATLATLFRNAALWKGMVRNRGSRGASRIADAYFSRVRAHCCAAGLRSRSRTARATSANSSSRSRGSSCF
mmetsp:Transcript_23317/g.71740  ORF Transcript_23317/g.71740 Transcript_23317/m.71740 type:complete len:341 (-) Transcript_23317:646-1668(-)